jgi:predicted nucleic acid-binding protein
LKVFFDTSVLVAASEQSHPHHRQTWPALRRVADRRDHGFMSVHSIAEMYAALTRLPVQPRIQPAQAERIILDNVLPHFEMVTVGVEYTDALRLVGEGGWGGAKIYDALLLGCANKCCADRIYTFNLTDFRQLAPELGWTRESAHHPNLNDSVQRRDCTINTGRRYPGSDAIGGGNAAHHSSSRRDASPALIGEGG